MGMDPARIHHLARLSRLAITDEEIPRLVLDLTRILEHVGTLQGVETPSFLENRSAIERREDNPLPSQTTDLLSLSGGCIQTATGERFVRVPTVVDKDS